MLHNILHLRRKSFVIRAVNNPRNRGAHQGCGAMPRALAWACESNRGVPGHAHAEPWAWHPAPQPVGYAETLYLLAVLISSSKMVFSITLPRTTHMCDERYAGSITTRLRGAAETRRTVFGVSLGQLAYCAVEESGFFLCRGRRRRGFSPR